MDYYSGHVSGPEGSGWQEVRDEAGGHGGDLQAAAAEFSRPESAFCDFSSNINPLGPPEGLLDELKGHINTDILKYPVPQARTLRRALAGKLGPAEHRLLLGNGASELIHLFFLWKRPRRTFIPAPTFSEYERGALLCGSEVNRIPLLPGEPLQQDAFLGQLQLGDCLVWCNPNNPTGTFYSRQVQEPLIRGALERGALVLLDESFFLLTGEPVREGFFLSDRQGLWTVVSLTKLYALPGIRLGFLAGPGQEVETLSRLGDPWRVNALAQRAGLYCLQEEEYIEKSIAMIQGERRFLMERLKALESLTLFPSAANFLLARGEKEGFSSTELHRRLADRGILIRNAANFPGLDQRYFRLAVRGRQENEKLIEAMQQVI